jgi:cation-transporting ATPase E
MLGDELRPEAQTTLEKFAEAGIDFKVISGDNPQTVAALAHQAGLPNTIGVVSGLELTRMSDTQFAQMAQEATIFGRITPEQKESLIEALKQQGRYVAMIGDGVNDVLSLKKAHLGIAMQSGSQATRNVADIILLNNSFASLPTAFQEGQRIRNGMQDILKLFLSRVLYIALLLVETLVIGGFPLAPKQTSVLTLLTVGIPTIALAAWARPGQEAETHIRTSLWHFVLPAALTVGIMALFIYIGEYGIKLVVTLAPQLQGDVTYENLLSASSTAASQTAAQSALMTFTVLCGILLILFVGPPSRFWVGGNTLRADRRITWLALTMFLIYLILLLIPPLRAFFGLTLLDANDYLVIGITAILWMFIVRWIWRAKMLEKFLGLTTT